MVLQTEISKDQDFRKCLPILKWERLVWCKSQYKNIGLGLNNFVGFPTFLFYPLQFIKIWKNEIKVFKGT